MRGSLYLVVVSVLKDSRSSSLNSPLFVMFLLVGYNCLSVKMFESKRSCHCFCIKVENAFKNWDGMSGSLKTVDLKGTVEPRLAGLYVWMLH